MSRIPDHIEDRAGEMIAQGEKTWVIAQKLGVSNSWVKALKQKINDQDVLGKIGHATSHEYLKVLENFRAGEDTMTIATMLDMEEWQVDSLLSNALLRERLNTQKT
jgi:hypothetical protein